jgi:two-component system NtrC family response regulator
MSVLNLLLIDDEQTQLKSLDRFLSKRQYKVFTAEDGPPAYEIAVNNQIDVVLTDFRMPDWNGFTVVKKMKELNPDIDIVVMTAFGNLEDAVEIMKAGAYDYLTKPIDLNELENLLNRLQEKRTLVSENRLLKQQLKERFTFEAIISQSGEMEEVLNYAARVASSKATVLLRGESGTGKELIARAIHFASQRREEPFVVVNIAALSESIVESELFGHEKGAFTGATQQRIGRFEQANGGTLFIDEVGDIPVGIQVKLLRAIQFGEFERIGGNTAIKSDTRIVAATHRDLEEMIRDGTFREDLYYRLNVVTIQIPQLQQRKTDIPVLIDHFIQKYAKANKKSVEGITRETLDQLMKYNFPGNVRELENMIEHAVVMARESLISIKDLPAHVHTGLDTAILNPYHLEDGYESKIRFFEQEMIREALKQNNGNQSAAARHLGITERHLRSRLEKLGLK